MIEEVKELRKKKVKEALSINSLDAKNPTEECMQLLNDYVEGKSPKNNIYIMI